MFEECRVGAHMVHTVCYSSCDVYKLSLGLYIEDFMIGFRERNPNVPVEYSNVSSCIFFGSPDDTDKEEAAPDGEEENEGGTGKENEMTSIA